MKKIVWIIISTVLLSSCLSKRESQQAYHTNAFINTAGLPYKESNDNLNKNTKIIYNAQLQLTVKNPDTINTHLIRIAKKYKGYSQTIGSHYSVIRVATDSLSKAISEIATLGKLESKNISGEDVTDQYQDLQIRLDNAEKARTRYLELLQKAQNVEETLKVEKELERLNVEIDLLKGKINRLSHLTEYSTISIYLKEKVKPGIVGYIFIGIYKTVRWLFVRN